VEGRGAAGGSEGGAACSGHSTGTRMPQRRCSCTDRVRAGTEGLMPDHVRPSAGARCGKAARRHLCGGAVSNHRPYRDLEPTVTSNHYGMTQESVNE